MTMFGFFMFKPLDDAQRARLAELIAEFGVELPAREGTIPMPGTVPVPGASGTLSGVVTYGDVFIEWEAGVPQRAVQISNPARWAWVPSGWWAALRNVAPPELWVPFTYLAFLESDYREDAKNPSDLEESWGALQVNRRAWPQYSVDYLTTYVGNIAAALDIYNIQGFGAWYNSARLLGLI